jgi:acyl-CoA dehydrogenase
MDFNLPPDTVMLRDMLRRFVQKEARPLEMSYFTTGELSAEERAQLRAGIEQLGLWGITVPERFGGGGLDVLTACVIETELAHTFIPLEIGEVTPLLYGCDDEQVARYLEPALRGERRARIAAREPGALRPDEWAATAIPAGDGYVVTGRKCLAGQPDSADFYIVLVAGKAPPANSGPSHGLPLLTAFLLEPDHPGLTIAPAEHSATFTPAHLRTYTLNLDACRVERSATLGEPGAALAPGAAEAPQAWIRTAARHLGLVERLTEMAAEHARDWVALGAPLAVRPAVRRVLAEMRVEAECARWLIYHAAWVADMAPADADLREAAAQARLAAGSLLERAIDGATLVYTGPGPSEAIEPQRVARSAVPAEALGFGVDLARAAVAAALLHTPGR